MEEGMEIRSKLWIEVKGEPVFGSGRKRLLEAIDQYGSINRAARAIDVSYRKAWSYINAMEERLSVPLVQRRTGGRHGGGASLTNEARAFIAKYEQLETGIQEMVDARFAEVFGPS
jgi:molybdate transport system regulatory protein